MIEIKLSDGRVIKMRKPKVRDMRMVANVDNDVEKEMKLIGNLTNLTFDELDEMDLDDYKKLQEALMGFFVVKWSDAVKGVALIGNVLHFGFNEIIEMEVDLFLSFIQEAENLLKTIQIR